MSVDLLQLRGWCERLSRWSQYSHFWQWPVAAGDDVKVLNWTCQLILGCVTSNTATATKTPTSSVHHNNFDPANPLLCIENNPFIPRNCTITRPPPITRPCKSPVVLRPPLEAGPDVDCDDDELLQKNKEYRYVPEKMTWDPNWLVTIVSWIDYIENAI